LVGVESQDGQEEGGFRARGAVEGGGLVELHAEAALDSAFQGVSGPEATWFLEAQGEQVGHGSGEVDPQTGHGRGLLSFPLRGELLQADFGFGDAVGLVDPRGGLEDRLTRLGVLEVVADVLQLVEHAPLTRDRRVDRFNRRAEAARAIGHNELHAGLGDPAQV